jgi:sterol desaturase/sphingolipid hydroxylase (fatty acid hydroxylase superfamily)
MVIDALVDAFGQAQQALFEAVVQPLMFRLGLASLLESGYEATGWLLVGLLQIAVMLAVIGPLQRWRPAEARPADPLARAERRAAVRVDVLYTFIHRLGLFRLALFFALGAFWDSLWGALAVRGWNGWQLDQALGALWPGVLDTAVAAFVLYLLVFDFADYLIHRGQHGFDRWWALHALHHSQRHMTMWTDSRNHLLDDLIRDVIMVVLAHAIGVPPGQFVAVTACTQLVENLSHADVRLSFGRWGRRLIVGPAFHRAHHAIGLGHESHGRGSLGGCNYAVLFPVWDILFGTARYDVPLEPTGIRDQLPGEGARDYGRGFWAQQWLGFKRLAGRA